MNRTLLLVAVLLVAFAGCVQKTQSPITSTVSQTKVEETTVAASTVKESTTVVETTFSKPTTIVESTLASTTTTTSTTSSTSTSLPPREIVFAKEGDYRLTMTFTGLDGAKHTANLDGGPFEVGDEFMINGRIYKYVNHETDDSNNLKVELKDISSFGRSKYTLAPKTGGEITLKTYSFIDSAKNDEEIELDPDTEAADTAVYFGTILGVPALADDGTLYLGVDGASKTTVGVNADVAGPSKFTDIQLSSWGVGVQVVAEKGGNINGAKGDVTDDDTDDVFIIVYDPGASGGKKIYIDFFDRNWQRGDTTNSVKVASSMATASSIGKTFFDLDTREETLIEDFPLIAYKYNVTYGSGNEIESVRVHT